MLVGEFPNQHFALIGDKQWVESANGASSVWPFQIEVRASWFSLPATVRAESAIARPPWGGRARGRFWQNGRKLRRSQQL